MVLDVPFRGWPSLLDGTSLSGIRSGAVRGKGGEPSLVYFYGSGTKAGGTYIIR